MPVLPRSLSFFLALLVLAGCSGDLGERLQDAAQRGAERAAEREVERRARGAVEGAFDVADNAVRCAVGDRACVDRARAEGRPVAVTDGDGNVVEQIPAGGAAGVAANADANYDFVPGERVLFATDFSDDNVGDFPRRLEFVEGNMEVVEWNGGRWLRATSDARFVVPLPETLPQRYTIEFDLHEEGSISDGVAVVPEETEEDDLHYFRDVANYFLIGQRHNSGIAPLSGSLPRSTTKVRTMFEGVATARIMVDGAHAKVYIDGQRVGNVPNARLGRGDALTFLVDASASGPTYLGNLRVAAGGRDLYDALATEGRVVTEGVHFDTGSARLRPESAAALGEIAGLLREHPDLRLRIEGHTDATGSAEANRRLSEQRAQAVRAWLAEQGIAGSRLEAAGMGQDHPVADNATEAGRQRNRRVELVRL